MQSKLQKGGLIEIYKGIVPDNYISRFIENMVLPHDIGKVLLRL
jgi:hypothetical protein